MSFKMPKWLSKLIDKWLNKVPSGPVVPPVVVPPVIPGSVWKGVMFFPADASKPWANPAYPTTASPQEWAWCQGEPWIEELRAWCLDSIVRYGGDTLVYKSEPLYNNVALTTLLCNPTVGNWPARCKARGVTRTVLSLFGGKSSSIPSSQREQYIRQICTAHAWATKDEVAYLLGLEIERGFSPDEAVSMLAMLRKYAGDKRQIVGSQNPDWLREVATKDKQVELWLESAGHPFNLQTTEQGDAYLSTLKSLQAGGRKVWAGEWSDGCNTDVMRYVTQKCIEANIDLGCGYFK